MYILHVILVNFVFCCSNVISYCNTNVSDPEIFIENYKTKDNAECITKPKNITYNEGDKINLKCMYAQPYNSKKQVKIQWKIQQHNRDLIVTPDTWHSSYNIFIILDRFDHNLKATCFSNRNESKFVFFHHNDEDEELNKGTSIGKMKSIKKITYTEGQTVANNNTSPVLLYVSRSGKRPSKIIEPNRIIFDRITLEDNENMISVWTTNSLTYFNTYMSINIEKHKRVIIVEPIKVPESAFPIIAVAGVTGLFLIIASICLYYKYFKQRETAEENNENIYEEPFQVVYAEIDLKDSNNPAPKLPEEPYAKIIGIIKRNRVPVPLPRNLVHE